MHVCTHCHLQLVCACLPASVPLEAACPHVGCKQDAITPECSLTLVRGVAIGQHRAVFNISGFMLLYMPLYMLLSQGRCIMQL